VAVHGRCGLAIGTVLSCPSLLCIGRVLIKESFDSQCYRCVGVNRVFGGDTFNHGPNREEADMGLQDTATDLRLYDCSTLLSRN
jgi:hypothetical protein